MKSTKKFVFSILGIAIIITLLYVYEVHFDYRFTEVTKGKVYRSAKIPPDQIDDYIKKYGIKTVIDLRIGNLIDPLNPSLSKDISSEKKAVETIKGVNYINIPSHQIPSEQNLQMFYETLDKENAFPALIHCHHGTGRAILYSALYRIEYEGLSNEEARLQTKFPIYLSSFDKGTPKGEWLKKYDRRKNTEYAVSPDMIQGDKSIAN
ncbi:dual specificity protein phosphatase family protein [Aquimarina sp. RZ0]|uniref:dual specificity protein phosphatase family protein n=1 Tax=Aquimarina sp. RZ0 TaxID=2607730 RepID=UPI0011F0A009|nr:dual specificity protein phosphatase family protein [Aquimarina sp. RZ0]KAA1245271.1 protein phosphatase [Aquimarina sp. RZ0]